ncbi:MAG TPA: TetR/AcrR family transcriptional regulator [bacterium]|nr:TetR/AcrR family transcriptional regulator [bacterium]
MAKRADFVESRRQKRRKQIFKGAVRVFAEKGYHSATTQEIADAAGLAKATLYEYVREKEDILLLTMEEAILQLNDKIEKALSGENNHEERLKKTILVQLEFARDFSGAARVLRHEGANLSAAGKKRYSELIDGQLNVMQTIIDEGIEAGCFRKLNSRVAAELFLHSCTYFFSYGDMPFQKPPIGDVIEFITNDVTKLITISPT